MINVNESQDSFVKIQAEGKEVLRFDSVKDYEEWSTALVKFAALNHKATEFKNEK